VQGVGFRYTVRSLAKHFPVTGYVQNLDDGRVLLVVEGAEGEIEHLLEQITDTMQGFVRNVQLAVSPPTNEFTGFAIRT
jgi:acylphosphatase